jgi:hypothetical protein
LRGSLVPPWLKVDGEALKRPIAVLHMQQRRHDAGCSEALERSKLAHDIQPTEIHTYFRTDGASLSMRLRIRPPDTGRCCHSAARGHTGWWAWTQHSSHQTQGGGRAKPTRTLGDRVPIRLQSVCYDPASCERPRSRLGRGGRCRRGRSPRPWCSRRPD